VADELRGRTFAFIQSLVRITLVATLVIAPVISALVGRHTFRLTNQVAVTYNGAAITFLIAAAVAMTVGVISYRTMDDRKGVPLVADLAAAVRGQPLSQTRQNGGLLISFEGGEGAGKSVQTAMLERRLAELGHDVVSTREPGGTTAGQQIRGLLLDSPVGFLAARTEALLYAADRAEHVETVIRPALARGAVVITDRFIDSSIAYQGAGRELPDDQVVRLSRWATNGLSPDLTFLLDVPPEVGLERAARDTGHDRLEVESLAFHKRVRQRFLDLAGTDKRRYVVIDATGAPEEIFNQIIARVEPLLPPPQHEPAAPVVEQAPEPTSPSPPVDDKVVAAPPPATLPSPKGRARSQAAKSNGAGERAASPSAEIVGELGENRASLIDELLGPPEG